MTDARPPFDLATYDYELPDHLIAQTPLERRDASRLLAMDRRTGDLSHGTFTDLPALLDPGDLLVVNRTRVLPARLLGHRLPGGGHTEILLLRQNDVGWEALVRPSRRLQVGTHIGFGDDELFAEVVGRDERGGRLVRFVDRDGAAVESARFANWLARNGRTPLPPYIREPLADPERYQTIFAQDPGSAAAPTAGLHLTPELLFQLRERGVALAYVVLHVGLDTFRPVESEDIRHHAIHTEWYEVSAQTAALIARARQSGRRVVAIGTTTARALETSGGTEGRGATRLFIYPGYTFRAIDALVTNFHAPCSSLLMLVGAFAGIGAIFRAYDEAIARGYRFLSFGDAMLIR
ncbi:MAG: tRNA preQ1(34) S-adenosylmethionine ribosyltransferase-isomerase QueA [Chloroflexi bacterium]|nr:tRNA preQ1(34) S-adenosylmethionine ribosyltransferase-isomerase QueA [Chloroflexota bacterium]